MEGDHWPFHTQNGGQIVVKSLDPRKARNHLFERIVGKFAGAGGTGGGNLAGGNRVVVPHTAQQVAQSHRHPPAIRC